MYYPQEVIDEVLANTDIVDVVSSHVHLKKRGKDYIGLCPFHNEKTPSFNVIPAKNMYYCFGCGAGGSAITFLMKYNNSSFAEALQDLADRAQITLPSPNYSEEAKKREQHRQDLLAINKETAVYYYRLLRSKRGERGMRYFTDRALSQETMKNFGLGFADGARSDLTAYLRKKGFSDELILESDVAVFDEKRGLHDRFFNRVMFPIQDVRGRVIGFGGRVLGDAKPKYINSSETQIFDKGRNLYALNLARRSKADHLILCEGYMDVIAMHQAGFTQAVASLGTAFTPGQAAILRRYTGKVLLAYDSDGAGVRAALRNIGILRAGGLESAVIDLRPHKDPDEFIKAEGKDAFQARIDGAENSFFYELRILSRSYRMDDPGSRTSFHREIARKLCTFSDEIERENYIAAAAEKYFIKTDSLRRLVAQYGMATGFGTEKQETLNSGRRKAINPQRPAGEQVTSASGSSAAKTAAGSVDGPGAGARKGPAGGRKGSAAAEGKSPPQPARETGTVENNSGTQRPADRRTGRPAGGPTRTQQALWRKQSQLLTWITEQPAVFSQVRQYLQPEDFDGRLYTETARKIWEQLEQGDKAVSAAALISGFETREEQEEAAAVLNTHLDGLEDGAERAKSLRELMFSVKEASVERMNRGDSGHSVSLQELLSAKQKLQTLRSIRLNI